MKEQNAKALTVTLPTAGVHRRAVRRRAAGLVQVRRVGAGRRRHRRHALRLHPQGLRLYVLHQEHVQDQVQKGEALQRL